MVGKGEEGSELYGDNNNNNNERSERLDKLILNLYEEYGDSWALIAKSIPGKTAK